MLTLRGAGPERDQQLVLLAIGKEFNFIAKAFESCFSCNARHGNDRLLQQRSGNRTVGYRQQVVRSTLAIAQRNAGGLHHMQANPVAIAPGWAGQRAYLASDGDVCPRQRLLQYVELHL